MAKAWMSVGLPLALVWAGVPSTAAVSVRDDTGQRVTLARAARRVVSLTPSSTEMLFVVGAGGSLVGVSGADDYPAASRRLPKVGSYSAPDLERIVAARPDLVVAAYGNPLEVISRVRRQGIEVYVCNPTTVAGVLRDLGDLGRLTGRAAAAASVVRGMEARLRRVEMRVRREPAVSALVVIWDAPLTVAGGKSFIQDILKKAGGLNAAGSMTEAYPKLDPERLVAMDPAVVLFPIGADSARVRRLAERPGFRQTRAARAGRFYTLNPDWLMRFGPRVIDGVEAVARLLHPSKGADQSSDRSRVHRSRTSSSSRQPI